ncbi:YggU family protein [Pasteurellaceae bacterium Orientalotternb1]|nr:YggU family protein [Pasteurellaceae bacterium Orientalotternb1]
MQAVECCENPQGIRLRIFLQPKASRDQIVGLHDNELKIAITAPPVDGQANAHLLKFLSKLFKVPKSSIQIEKGELQRHKQIFVPAPKQIPSDIAQLLKTL